MNIEETVNNYNKLMLKVENDVMNKDRSFNIETAWLDITGGNLVVNWIDLKTGNNISYRFLLSDFEN